MTRTYEQLYNDARAQRAKMIKEGRDPKDGVFVGTVAEKAWILDRPQFMCYELSAARDRICGLKIALIDGISVNGRAAQD